MSNIQGIENPQRFPPRFDDHRIRDEVLSLIPSLPEEDSEDEDDPNIPELELLYTELVDALEKEDGELANQIFRNANRIAGGKYGINLDDYKIWREIEQRVKNLH